MKRNQSGFTLIEIAIVLVIIGLLLGGVMKGQELINSAKVKNFGMDFKNIPIYIYGYQDKFRALPGDDLAAASHVTSDGITIPNGNGNGVMAGNWDTVTAADETVLFWQHVRLAGLATGSTTIPATLTRTDPYFPTNAIGGRIGIESGSAHPPIDKLKGSYYLCSEGILGKFVTQLDLQMDNGAPDTGAMMAYAYTPPATPRAANTTGPAAATSIEPTSTYTVCLGI
ncbi:MAG: prepilin-type N-terminal cleavage/methylation domain-containing protein [Sideroxydans sp.]|nr:prepilin-type N-terminal cleavage/methylation domain-containing protein [Sideroxydans sp.]NOT99610.1 prepilin-type N-terminal cleavage/methylation domain-containing protein [Sideroxydans sp.]